LNGTSEESALQRFSPHLCFNYSVLCVPSCSKLRFFKSSEL